MAANNAINNQAYSLLGPSYVGVNYATAYVNINSGSNTIIYTCPAGKRAYPLSFVIRNPTGSTINYLTYLRTGGVDYQIYGTAVSTLAANTTQAISQLSTNNFGFALSYILEAGESIVFNGNGLNVFITMFEYANNVPVFSSRSFLGSTTNVIYTVPANKKARIGVNSIVQNGIFYRNNGGASTATCYAVPSGGSPGSTNQYGTTTTSFAAPQYFNQAQGSQLVLNSGDFIQINLTAAISGVAWANVWEID